MKIHRLKTFPTFYRDIISVSKRFEVRLNNRDFRIGDMLLLEEYNPETHRYTGAKHWVRVVYLMTEAPGLKRGYCLLGLTLAVYFSPTC